MGSQDAGPEAANRVYAENVREDVGCGFVHTCSSTMVKDLFETEKEKEKLKEFKQEKNEEGWNEIQGGRWEEMGGGLRRGERGGENERKIDEP